MQWCRDCYVRPAGISVSADKIEVLDVGAADYNGSYRQLFDDTQFHYRAADLTPHETVDIVIPPDGRIPVADCTFDIVISGQALEHAEFFWETFSEMVRVTKADGLIFLIVPSAGPIHRYPVDCYRFYPDAMSALARYTKTHLVDCWHDPRGPWKDLVGVFSVSESRGLALAAFNNKPELPKLPDPTQIPPGSTEDEKCSGERPYLEVLGEIHQFLKPRSYLEIGVRQGHSLALSQCPSLAIDPWPDLSVDLSENTTVVQSTSDQFFRNSNDFDVCPDLAFIDGCHLFEYVLRDFMYVESCAGPNTLVVIDDILPNSPVQAQRDRVTRAWTGDVWKIADCLARHRPDLWLLALDTYPTGLLLVAGCNPENRKLWENYNPIVRHYNISQPQEPAADVLTRTMAVSPSTSLIEHLATTVRARRDNPAPSASRLVSSLDAAAKSSL